MSFNLVHFVHRDLRYIYDVLRKGVKEHLGVSKVRYIKVVTARTKRHKNCDKSLSHTEGVIEVTITRDS